jgi:hypothetical protein
MEFVLLDWTRMGKTYCLAGVVREAKGFRVVRPLLTRGREAPVRHSGWSPWHMDCHSRWEVFELIAAEPATPNPPHVEDVWVRTLRPCRRMADIALRRAILSATMASDGELIFGAPLQATYAAAHLEPGTGTRSLVTIVVSPKQLAFTVSRRQGASDQDVRVNLPVPGVGERYLPVKDHHLLCRATAVASESQALPGALDCLVGEMGDAVAIRLGLSRPFQGGGKTVSHACWLMADGFFSLNNPEP